MTFLRNVPKPSTVRAKAGNWTPSVTTTHSPLEVIRGKIETRPTRRSPARIIVFSGGHGAVMYPQDSHYLAAVQSRAHIYVSLSVLGCLLLTLVGCTVFRLCKKRGERRRLLQSNERRAPQPASQRRSAAQPPSERRALVTPDRQQSPIRDELETAHDTSEQHLSVLRESDEDEFQHLPASRRTASSIQYSSLPQYYDANASGCDKSNRYHETSFTESAIGVANGSGIGGAQTESAGEPSPGTRHRAEIWNGMEKVDSRTDVDHAVCIASEEGTFHADDQKTTSSSYGHQALCSQKAQEDPDGCERSSPGADVEELFTQIDTASDSSGGYLANVFLDVSSEHSDLTEGDRTQGSSASRATDDSIQSFESFSRLQDVKAQAEFSPYHIAWSTPLFPQHSALQRRQAHKVPAAKKLNMDAANTGSFLETAKGNVSHIPEEPPGWEFLKPQDALCRPASAEYRTPRPVFCREKYRSLLGVNGDLEQQPLLPYSVLEYQRSLKNIAEGNTLDPKEAMSSEQLYPSLCSPQSSHSSNSTRTSLVNESGAYRTVDEVSTAGSGSQSHEDTLQNLPSFSVNGTANNTAASWSETTHSSTGDVSSSAVSASWHNGDHQSLDLKTHNSEVGLNNNGDVKAILGKEFKLSHSQDLPAPFSSKLPFQVPLVEADPCTTKRLTYTERPAYSLDTFSGQLCSAAGMKGERVTDSNNLPPPSSQGLSKTFSTRQLPETQTEVLDNFKVPYPVSSSASFRIKDGAKPRIPRSKSSRDRPLAHGTLLEPGETQIRRSKTSDSISSSTTDQQHPMSLDSLSDVSAIGSSASRLSLQDPSLTWDNEFTGSDRGHDDSLAWEDDPYLS